MIKYIISHKSPDTDTICSSIIYSLYLKRKSNIETQVCRLGELNNETKFVLDKFGFDVPELKTKLDEGSEIILMDHNEACQSIDDRKNYKIIQIIDHHKMDFSTKEPLFIRAEPIGATCSIVAKMFFEDNIKLKSNEAALLISAIISDTLFFRSPTTTKEDINLVNKLNEIAKIDDLKEYSLKLFERKSDLGDISIEELIKLDYKNFDINGKKLGVGVMETTNPNFALNKKEEIINKLNQIKKNDNLDIVFLSIIDILEETNTTLYPDEGVGDVLKTVFNVDTENGVVNMGRILSRKKQIIPKLDVYLNN